MKYFKSTYVYNLNHHSLFQILIKTRFSEANEVSRNQVIQSHDHEKERLVTIYASLYLTRKLKMDIL